METGSLTWFHILKNITNSINVIIGGTGQIETLINVSFWYEYNVNTLTVDNIWRIIFLF